MNDGFLDGPQCCAIARSGTGRARQQPYEPGVGAGDQGGELVGHQRPDRSAGGLLGVQAVMNRSLSRIFLFDLQVPRE